MRSEERVRQVKKELEGKPELLRATLSELHRREALQSVSEMAPSNAPAKKAGVWDALLNTESGKTLVEAKRVQVIRAREEARAREEQARAEARVRAEAERIRRFNESRRIAVRIRQLKELAFDVFVRGQHRKDLYEQYKNTIRKVGEVGGCKYDEALSILQTTPAEADDFFHYLA